jgi:hypothetical protein
VEDNRPIGPGVFRAGHDQATDPSLLAIIVPDLPDQEEQVAAVVHPHDPLELTELLPGTGWDSLGLHVGATEEVEHWWSGGSGERNLARLVDLLLQTRVTVLDVGRVPLGPELCVVDIGHPYGRVLEVGTRLGAQFVTVRAGSPRPDGTADDPAEFFARLADLAGRYHLRPLLSLTAGTAVATLEQALAVVDGTGGGVVLDVVPGRDTAAEVDETVVELGERLGYVRVSARALAHTAAPGLLATLPPQVPVAIGGAPEGTSGPADEAAEPPPVDRDAHVTRVRALRAGIDAMLRHPQSAGR